MALFWSKTDHRLTCAGISDDDALTGSDKLKEKDWSGLPSFQVEAPKLIPDQSGIASLSLETTTLTRCIYTWTARRLKTVYYCAQKSLWYRKPQSCTQTTADVTERKCCKTTLTSNAKYLKYSLILCSCHNSCPQLKQGPEFTHQHIICKNYKETLSSSFLTPHIYRWLPKGPN